MSHRCRRSSGSDGTARTSLLLLIFSGFVVWFSVPFFMSSWELSEISAAPGGLPYRWFLKSFLVTAFVLLALSGLGRLTRVWAALFGRR